MQIHDEIMAAGESSAQSSGFGESSVQPFGPGGSSARPSGPGGSSARPSGPGESSAQSSVLAESSAQPSGPGDSSAQFSGLNKWENTKDDDIMKQQSSGLAESSAQFYGLNEWENTKDDDIMKQQSAIKNEESDKAHFIGDKEPISSLAAEYESGSQIMKEKIKVLDEQYAAIRRARGDGNCFFRSFMFSYLEHIFETQDQEEVERIKVNVEECRNSLKKLGYPEFTFEDFFSIFLEQLESVIQGHDTSISSGELLQSSRDQSVSDYVVMFFRFVTSGEIRKRTQFFEPFILGLTGGATVEKFCKSSVEPMGEESDHVHIIALSDALGVPIRVVYLDRSPVDGGTGGAVGVNNHDFVPSNGAQPMDVGGGTSTSTRPAINLLYRPGHYDILYPK